MAHDPVAAASFALGVARVQGSVRRVAIADLIGEVAPLQSLVTGDDAHGISDSFLYGVSLNKIAQPLEGSGNVFLMPSGTEPVAIETVYNNDRWRKLAAGFQQVGALLLVVAVANAPGFNDLCAYIGAVFPIGDAAPSAPIGVPVISMPRPTPPEVERVVAKARAVGSEDATTRRNRIIAAVLATIGVALLVGFLWPQIVERLPDSIVSRLPGRGGHAPNVDSAALRADSTKPPLNGALRGDSAANVNGVANTNSTGKSGAVLTVSNPHDSLRAAQFAVYISSASTADAVMSDQRIQSLPAVALTPVLLANDSLKLFRLTVGAGEDQATIDALLARLRAGKVLGATSGTIIRVPFALRLAEGLAVDSSADAVARYAKRGVVAYALRQADGRVSIFSGAHETVAQAAILADSLRAMGIVPVLVYRTGRAF